MLELREPLVVPLPTDSQGLGRDDDENTHWVAMVIC